MGSESVTLTIPISAAEALRDALAVAFDAPARHSAAARRREKNKANGEGNAEALVDSSVWVAALVDNAGTKGALDPLVSLTAFAVSEGYASLRDVPVDERERFALAYAETPDATAERLAPGADDAPEPAPSTAGALDDW